MMKIIYDSSGVRHLFITHPVFTSGEATPLVEGTALPGLTTLGVYDPKGFYHVNKKYRLFSLIDFGEAMLSF